MSEGFCRAVAALANKPPPENEQLPTPAEVLSCVEINHRMARARDL